MNITALLKVQQENIAESSIDVKSLMAKALVFIVQQHFQSLSPSFVLTTMCVERAFCNFFNDLLDNVLQACGAMPLQIVSMSEKNTPNIPGRRDLNLILVDSFESFRSIDVISHTARYDHNEFYYIILKGKAELHLMEEMGKIFDYSWENHMINCNVQLQSALGELLIYTYYPFTSESCNKASIKLTNQFRGEALLYKNLFPKKLLNFHQCEIRVAVRNTFPCIFMEAFKNGSGILQRGYEVRIINTLARKLNFSIEVKVPPNNEQRGIKHGQNNMTGGYRMVHESKADLTMSCHRLSLDRATIATAIAHSETSLHIWVPVAAYDLSPLQKMLFPFTPSTWISILVIYAFVHTTSWIVKKFRRFYPHLFPNQERDFNGLSLFLMALGMPVTVLPERVFARLLYVNWMIVTLILRTGYQALIYHMMRTNPINSLPTTFEDLIGDNYTLVLSLGSYLTIKDVPFISELSSFVIVSDTELAAAFRYAEEHCQRRLGVADVMLFFSYYENLFGKHHVFHRVKAAIISLGIALYVKKHSYLSDRFNELILILRSAGLTERWMRQETDVTPTGGHVSKDDESFSLKDIYMAFVMLIMGYIFALIIFLVEVFSRKICFLTHKIGRRLKPNNIFSSDA